MCPAVGEDTAFLLLHSLAVALAPSSPCADCFLLQVPLSLCVVSTAVH